VDFNTVSIAIAALGGLGFLFSIGLAIANKIFYVEEDPRISQIIELLPGANCGACGFPGCTSFAENLVNGNIAIDGCPVCSSDVIEEVAAIMGVEAEKGERMIARVMCQGGIAETAKKAEYVGIRSCIAADIIYGVEKLCDYGCIGYGDCIEACPFDAMYMNKNGLPVVLEHKCTGCGQCVKACPRNVIELHPLSHKIFVLCKNKDNPKYARKVCTRSCIACGICVRAVDEGQIGIVDNLAQINYKLYGTETKLPTDKCPTDCIVVIDKKDEEQNEKTIDHDNESDKYAEIKSKTTN